jgi:hypothetical protein
MNKDFGRARDRTDTGVLSINQHRGLDTSAGDIGEASAGWPVGRTRSGHRQLVTSDRRFVAGRGYLL